MADHRPLSPWVAWLEEGKLGPTNNGDERADARHLRLFKSGWNRGTTDLNGQSVLILWRADDHSVVVELDNHGVPIVASPAAAGLIARAEETWPDVGNELLDLAGEALPLRYWVLERLNAEGDPPDSVFALLPWDLLDRATDAVCAALGPGRTIGPLVEIRHWLTPAVPGVTGPLEQLDHGLRSDEPDAPDVARAGATTLLTNLRDVPLTRIPVATRLRLRTLVLLLGQAYQEHRDLVEVAARRLTDATSSIPDDPSILVALVVPSTFAGPDDEPPETQQARLELAGSAAELLGPDARGRLTRRAGELVVTLIRVAAGVSVSVQTDEPGAVLVRLEPDGTLLRARLPWHQTGLPDRLIFRVVTE